MPRIGEVSPDDAKCVHVGRWVVQARPGLPGLALYPYSGSRQTRPAGGSSLSENWGSAK